MTTSLGIYVHIPFCVQKCPYCDFNSFAVSYVSDDIYRDAVLREFTAHIEKRPALSNRLLQTIYMGGGTPSLIHPNNIKRVVSGIRQFFINPREQEITMEINPGTITGDKLSCFRDGGINRLSIGIQSFHDERLNALGRIHSVEDSLTCYEHARMAGFDNIGVDLIFGAPGQSIEEWGGDLKKAVSLKPEHISTYNLTIEPGTPFFKLQQDRCLALPSEEEQILMYELAMDTLKRAGYSHYEISNFAVNGFESRHNIGYWSGMDYIGLGAGAHSYLSHPQWGMRWWNEQHPTFYLQHIKDTGNAVVGKEELTKQEAMEEGIFLGLRRIRGIDIDAFSRRFTMHGKDFSTSKINALEKEGLLYAEANNLRLTHKGLLLSNEVFAAIIS